MGKDVRDQECMTATMRETGRSRHACMVVPSTERESERKMTRFCDTQGFDGPVSHWHVFDVVCCVKSTVFFPCSFVMLLAVAR